MTNLLEVLTEIYGLSGRLNPSAFDARVHELTRGGLPGGQGDGRRSANRADPSLDSTDVWLLDQQADYEVCLLNARDALVDCETIQGAVLRVAEAVDGVAKEDAVEKLWCRSCIRVQYCQPRLAGVALERFGKEFGQPKAHVAEKEGWCRDCARWWAIEGVAPPVEYVERVVVPGGGGRLTARLRKEILANIPKRKTRKKRVKR